MQQTSVIKLLLQFADNALILGHRLSEWCGHGPILEQDIAITNMSLDHLGQCRYLYDIVAAEFNHLNSEDKYGFFLSVALNEKIRQGHTIDQDDLAYLRDSWEYRNVLLVEQPNGNWADTIARSYFYDTFMTYMYTAMKSSNNEELAAVAEKSLKEVEYHKKWSSDWMLRLGDGTEESHAKLQDAVSQIWNYTGELFHLTDEDREAYIALGVSTPGDFYNEWLAEVSNLVVQATLAPLDEKAWMHKGGKQGQHSEHLGYILTELQYIQRAYPNMKW